MTIDNMFNAAKAGDLACDAYKVGDISKKTGLQKQPDGSWKKPGEKTAGESNKTERSTAERMKDYVDALRKYNGKFNGVSKKQKESTEQFYQDMFERLNRGFNDKSDEPAPKRESVSSRRMEKDLDGNFWSRPEDFKEDITSRGWDVEEMNGKYAVISNEAGSQYEVRFDDHSDDGDLTVKTFKPLRIDEDDEESDDAGLQGIFESLKK